MGKEIKLPDIPEEEQTPLVKELLEIIEQLAERVQRQDEEIQQLKDEIAVLKGEKKRPKFKPSWETPDGRTLLGRLPTALEGHHFGPALLSYILYQHHHRQVTQPLLLEQLREGRALISPRARSTNC